jgi:hypothetical protein
VTPRLFLAAVALSPLLVFAQDAAVPAAPKSGLLDLILQPILLAIATALAGFLTAALAKLGAKWKIELNQTQEAALRSKIRNAVLQVEQTYVSQLRAARADGKLTGQEALEALTKAIGISARDLGEQGKAKLISLTGKGGDALREVVEEEVGALKLLKGAAPKA